jgi:uncharacterized coiled-coil DUF342 family protein
MTNRITTHLILISTINCFMSYAFPAFRPPPAAHKHELEQIVQEAQRDVGRWRWENQAADKTLSKRYINFSVVLADAHHNVIRFENELNAFTTMVGRAHTQEGAVQFGEHVKELRRQAYEALNRITQISTAPDEIKQKTAAYVKTLEEAKNLIEKLFIKISITSDEARAAHGKISQEINDKELSQLSVEAYGKFIQDTFKAIIATNDLAAISILMQKLAEKCSMNLDMLEILCVNWYTQEYGEKAAEEKIPELPAEEGAPAEGEEGGEAPPPPPPAPDIDLYAGKESSAAGQDALKLIAEKRKGKLAGGEKEEQPAAQRPDLTAALKIRKPLRHVEVAPKTSEEKQPQRITPRLKGQAGQELTTQNQIKKLEAQITKIPDDIQKIADKIKTAQTAVQGLDKQIADLTQQIAQKKGELETAQKEKHPELKEEAHAYDQKIKEIKAELIKLQNQATELQKKLDLPRKLAEQQKNLERNLKLAQQTLAKLQQKKEITLQDLIKQRRQVMAPKEEEEEWD